MDIALTTAAITGFGTLPVVTMFGRKKQTLFEATRLYITLGAAAVILAWPISYCMLDYTNPYIIGATVGVSTPFLAIGGYFHFKNNFQQIKYSDGSD